MRSLSYKYRQLNCLSPGGTSLVHFIALFGKAATALCRQNRGYAKIEEWAFPTPLSSTIYISSFSVLLLHISPSWLPNGPGLLSGPEFLLCFPHFLLHALPSMLQIFMYKQIAPRGRSSSGYWTCMCRWVPYRQSQKSTRRRPVFERRDIRLPW